tara:strand:- start:7 stop:207 length:201 start_codon:yes stop_codon:yes gene_type:complete
MKGNFQVLIDKKVKKFTNYEDIPETISEVISFEPDFPEPPHTEEQHNLISTFNDKLKELLSRASSN